jgi:hypothetical protein
MTVLDDLRWLGAQDAAEAANEVQAAFSRGGSHLAQASTFDVRERWEGTVEERLDTYFVATLINLASGEEATAELFFDDVPEDDRELVVPGALFYWYVGTLRDETSEFKASKIRFRRAHRSRMTDMNSPTEVESFYWSSGTAR